MALISQIRKHGSWIMVIMIALGVGGFIIMDMTVGQTSLFGSGRPTLGKVNGEKLNIQEFTNIETVLGSTQDVYARRNSLWSFLVEDIIIKGEAEKLGISVSETELNDLQYGPEPSAIIMQRFMDPVTQQINREQLTQIKQQIESNTADPQLKAFWTFQQREITKDRLQAKLTGMVSKGIYTPSWMAERINTEQNQLANFAYIKVPFETIDNSDVALEDADFKAFLKENAASFKTKEELRRLQYVVFDVKPSNADSTALVQSLTELAAEFRTTDNDTNFIERNLGILDGTYYKKEELSPVIADTVLRLPVGTVYGPYIDGTSYRVVKILDRKVVPDSVRSRHILIPATDQISLIAAQKRVDSLKQVIEEGKGTFDALARQFGTDGTVEKGGDLGFAFAGQMVKPFNDLIFYKAEEGKLYTVTTEFGVHLVEVTAKKFINNSQGARLAYLTKSIIPSEETRNNRYDQVLAFLSKNKNLEDLKKSVEKQKSLGLTLETTPPLTENDFSIGALGSGQQSRDIIRWAFTASSGDVSNVIYAYTDPIENYDNKYVIAALKGIQDAGTPTLEQIKEDIEPAVMNRKKGEMISERLKGKGLNSGASEFKVAVDTANNVNFSMAFIPDLGNEPKVLGTVFRLEQGKESAPIIGNGGVYVVKPILKSTPTAMTNLPGIRQSVSSAARGQVSAVLMQGMRTNAKVKDFRSKFF